MADNVTVIDGDLQGSFSVATKEIAAGIHAQKTVPVDFLTPGGVSIVVDTAEVKGLGVVLMNKLQAGDGVAVLDSVSVTGLVPHNAALASDAELRPTLAGAQAVSALSGLTLVSAADLSNMMVDLDGALLVRQNGALADFVSGVAAITDGASTQVIAAAGAGIKVYVTDVIISNSSATPVTVDLRDGTAGAVKVTYPAPPDTHGVVHALRSPLAFTANTIVAADPSAAATTVTVTLLGFKSKV